MSISLNGFRRPALGLVRAQLLPVIRWPLILWAVLVMGLHAGPAHARAGVSSEVEVLRCEAGAGAEGPRSCETALDGEIDGGPENAGEDATGNMAESSAAAPAAAAADPDEPAGDEPEADPALNVRAGAPMCDVMGASTVAVLEIPEVDRARLEQLPCDSQRLLSLLRGETPSDGKALLSGGRPRPPAPQSVLPLRELGDAAPVPSAGLAARAAPARLARDVSSGLGWRSGHRSRVERPPAAAR